MITRKHCISALLAGIILLFSGCGAKALEPGWWQHSAFYHIWIKSFYDSDGDGCGDIRGVTEKLDYIQHTVGCDAIWLSPFFDCASKGKASSDNMHGYDVVDYYAVNDYLGTMQDVEQLINACHRRNMKLIFDFVPNHTSSSHPWFENAASGGDKRDWYVWSDTKLNWHPMGNAETWHLRNGSYYYGAFGSSMPDLNYRNAAVREEMKNVVRFWLDKGFDGVRVDAVRYLMEDGDACTDTPQSHQWFRELRSDVLDSYESAKLMICEAWVEHDRATLDEYFGDGREFQMVFDFDQGRPCIASVKDGYDATGATMRANPADMPFCAYGTFLGNHDEYAGRFGQTLGSDRRKINLATALSLLRPTVPFIYYGNELGQKETSYGGDLRLRGPFQWQEAAAQEKEKGSPLGVNHALLALRRAYPELFARGRLTKLQSESGSASLAYVISGATGKEGALLCAYNLSNQAVEQLSFSGIQQSGSAYCLVGDAEAPSPTFSAADGTVTLYNLAPCSFRVYVLDGTYQKNLRYDIENYLVGEIYVPKRDTRPLHMSASFMYLRGSMNDWGAYPMTAATDADGNTIWRCVCPFDKAQTIEFKFCVNDGADWGASWGTPTGSNIVQKVEKGSYRFEFNEEKRIYSVTKEE